MWWLAQGATKCVVAMEKGANAVHTAFIGVTDALQPGGSTLPRECHLREPLYMHDRTTTEHNRCTPHARPMVRLGREADRHA